MLVRHWQRTAGTHGAWWRPPAEVLKGVAALAAVSVAVIVGWSVFALGLIIAAFFVFAIVMAETSQPDY
jgi:hypothetical protein